MLHDEIKVIFDAMRVSPMNDWVGGTDPESVGDATAAIVQDLTPPGSESKILDFGCGIGRGMVSLLKLIPTPSALVGIDIMPPVIKFCDEHIKPVYPFAKFELLDDSNIHYDQFIDGQPRSSKEAIVEKYASSFTHAYAFSVFTHIARKDFEGLLRFIYALMAPGGRFLFTCFSLTEHSRSMITNGQSIFPFQESTFVDDGDVFLGNKSDPLAFIAFDQTLLERIVWGAGLVITKVQYGCWMGGNIGASLQDVFVVTKPFELQKDGEVVMTPLVDRTNIQH